MATKQTMGDLIVFLPGIMGSVLAKDGRELWAPSPYALGRGVLTAGAALRDLQLAGDDPTSDYLDDKIRATSLVSGIHGIHGLNLIDGYGDILRFLAERFTLVEGRADDEHPTPANFIPFPYDWRRDNRAAAHRLARLVEARLKLWRDNTRYVDAKVILIGHSMGGLVARYYTECLEGWRDCRALITFGTPHRGSVNSLDFLNNGYKLLFLDLAEVLRSFTSAYQLLPRYPVLRVNGEYRYIKDVPNLRYITQDAATAAYAFHSEIEQAAQAHQRDLTYRDSFTTIPIVGTLQTTNQSAALEGGRIVASTDLPPNIPSAFGHGDGTVPFVSAIPIELSNDYRETFRAVRHSWIHSDSMMLDDLATRLTQMQTDLSRVRGSEPTPAVAGRPALSLSVDSLYRRGEPVQVGARIINQRVHPRSLTARLVRLDADAAPLSRSLAESDAGWHASFEDVAAGVYRLEVEPELLVVDAIHDIVEVFA